MSQLPDELGVSLPIIHRHKNALEKAGYLVLLNPGGNPLYYGPGPIPLPSEKDIPSGMVEHRNLKFNLHHIKIYFPVISPPKKDLAEFNWDNIWSGSKNDFHYHKNKDLDKLSTKIAPVKSITYHQGNKASLQISLDRINVPVSEFKITLAKRWAHAQDIANSFSKQFGCRFGLPIEPEDPHAALPPPPGIDEKILRKAKEMNIRTEYASTEGSDGPLEIEIQHMDLLNAYENLPKIIDALTVADKENREYLMKQAQKANITIATISKITNILAGHQKQLNLLLMMVSGTAHEEKKESTDPGEMFG